MDSVDSLIIENPNPKIKANEYQIVFLLAFVSFICSTDSMLLMPLGEIIMKTYKVTPTVSTLVISVYSLFAGISGFLSTSIMDRFDRKRLLIGTFIGFSVGTLLCGTAHDYALMVLYRGITGIFGGIVGGVGVSIISDLIPYERRSTAMSIISLSFAVAAITGVPLGIHLANTFNLQMPFQILAVISFITLIPIILWLPKINKHIKPDSRIKNPFKAGNEILKDKNQVLALLMAFFIVFSHFVVLQFIVPYMEINVGFDKKLVPIMYAIGGVCAIVTAPFIGKISDRIGNLKSFTILMLLSFIPIIMATHIHRASIPLAIFVCATFFIFAAGRMIPAYTLMSGATTADKRGSFMSMRSACLELGTGIASVVSGFIVKQGLDGKYIHFNYVGYVSVAVGLLAIYIASKVKIVSSK
ncbi:MAG: MFS transporter [Chitinophagales bacterium]